MQPNILQCTGQNSALQKSIQPQMSIVPRLRKLVLTAACQSVFCSDSVLLHQMLPSKANKSNNNSKDSSLSLLRSLDF